MGSRSDKIQKNKVALGLQNTDSRKGRFRAFDAIRPAMKKMVKNYPYLSNELRQIKQHCIDNLEEMISKATLSLERKGCHVYVAETTEQAQAHLLSLIPQGVVVKSKTNAGKEINLTHVLEERDIQVIETDLGDRINQLAHSEASHSLAPAIHIPIEKVTEVFSKEMGTQLECSHEALVVAARKGLRDYLINADVGISGANAIAADTGSVFVTENEGNIRAVTMMPKIHIVIAGVEKIVPTLEDALKVVRSAAVYGVGQDIGTYVSVISGTSTCCDPELDELIHGQGPQEVHILFLKHGRQEAIDKGFAESLYCINCGSCLNFCPIYAEIGEKYGYKYLGGRGLVFTAFHGDLQKTVESGLSLCIGCQKCKNSCPVQMNTPEMLKNLRQEQVQQEGLGWKKERMLALLSKPKGLPRLTKVASTFGGTLLKKSKIGVKTRFSLPSLGLPGERLLPAVQKKSFLENAKPKPIENPVKTVAFFPGCVVNYTEPSVGEALLHVLGENKVAVKLAKEDLCCGIPGIVSGDKNYSRQMALRNIEIYSQFDTDALVFVCPSCAVAFKEEYPKLFAKDDPKLLQKVIKLAQKVKDINQFLIEDIELVTIPGSIPEKITYHDPCHLVRSLGITQQPRQLIQTLPGAKFEEMVDADACCGFGGSFSIDYYDLSRRINEGKLTSIENTGATILATSCPGCMLHFRDGITQKNMKQQVFHTIQLLSQTYGRRNKE
ncbi:CoB--CoM heterodisulfide reductase [Desulforamulus reducens MI-1]|uniref:CoB--CoM heterodisulfide reductase n=1 Tax=Desulforamulus reducens (strain ATCC BAA-1160 / DSM 100696 / MI-1) TaxID=349161 RepID=A4J1M6_DESRM|nr:LUD domain-containing protein [Desulforamulus reducens]ABO48979.1 CoB--CoM heterodisulfide reductase [Desulforamulus reducens MI-1]